MMRWWESRAFAVAALIVSVLPLLWPTVPPLTDLPGHIGRYRVMLGDEAATLGQWYQFTWRPVGNLGVDLLVAAVAPWIGLEPAVKAVVIAIPALTTGAVLWVSRELHGRVSPFALFALPFAYSYPLHFGFVNYALAMALALAGWALWMRLGRMRRLRTRAALFVGIGLIIFIAHVMGWAMLCLFVFGGEWARARGEGRKLLPATVRAGLGCLPLALPLLVFVLWRNGEGGGVTGQFFDIVTKMKGFASTLRDRWFWFDVGSLALVCGVIYATLRRQIGQFQPAAAAAAGLATLAFLLLPFTVMGSAYADLRLLPYAMIVALAGIAPKAEWSVKMLQKVALAGVFFFLIRAGGTTVSLALYDRDWTRELAALDHVPRGSRVLALAGETCDQPWAHARRTHLAGLAIARRASFANDQWRMEGAPLMTVRLPGAGYFAHDPSQIAVDTACSNPDLMPQHVALSTFPRAIFTHVWLIRPHSVAPDALNGLTPLWSNGVSTLYAVNRNPSRLPVGAAGQ